MPPKPTSPTSLLSLSDQFTFYGQYHTHRTNILIHILCVPTIFWTSLVLLNKIPGARFGIEAPWLLGGGEVSLGWGIGVGYALYFMLLEPVAGGIYFPLLLTLGRTATSFSHSPHSTPISSALFILAWIAQFIGHGAFEGRAPALLDSLFQSLVLAVFFVWMEVLFALGYRKEFRKGLEKRIGREVEKFRAERGRRGKKVE